MDLSAYINQERRITNKQLREHLMAQHPFCYWCHTQVYEYPALQNRNLTRGEKYPRDMATLEHLYDRYDTRRYQDYQNQAKVLACYQCNHTRAQRATEQIPRAELTRRIQLGQERALRKSRIPRPLLFPPPEKRDDSTGLPIEEVGQVTPGIDVTHLSREDTT